MHTPQQAIARNRSLYQLLCAAEDDLSQARYFAEYLLKKGWHFEPWERRWITYMQQSAFTTAFVIAYSRPFVESRGFPNFPKRLIPYNSDQHVLHLRVLNLRNLIYAHSDIGTRNVKPITGRDFPARIAAVPAMRLTKNEIECLLQMIELTKNAIQTRLKQLHDTIQE